MSGLEILCLFLAVGDLSQDLLERDALIDHHNDEVIEQVGDLINGLDMVAVFRGDYGFGTFLANLFEYLVDALVQKIARIGILDRVIPSVLDRLDAENLVLTKDFV